MNKSILSLLLFLSLFSPLSAQKHASDSLSYVPLANTRPLTALISVGAPLVAYDLMHFRQDASIRGMRQYYASGHNLIYDDVLSMAPFVTAWGMRLAGLEGRSQTILEGVTAQSVTYALAGALTYGLKYTVKRVRPDGSSANSFPSGHAAFAFASAAILDAEYGQDHPWLSALGYSAATLTGIGRILNNRHWATDVVTGAGIGLGSAYVGYWLSDIIFKRDRNFRDAFTPQSDAPWMISVDKGFQTYLSAVGDYKASGIGNSTGLSVRIPLYGGWGVRAQGLFLESRNTEASEALQGFAVLGKVDYMHPFWEGRLWLDGNLGLGYGSEMRLQVSEESFETSAPFVTPHLPVSIGAGATLSLLPNFGLRLGADYLYAFNARPYSRDTKKGMKGFLMSLSLNYLIPQK